MLRAFFNALSRSRTMKRMAAGFGPARRFARRFTAGETLDEAVAVVRELNARGMDVTLNHLGESVAAEKDARRAAEEYVRILERICDEGLRATVSVKPSHLGLEFGTEFFEARLREVAKAAAKLGNQVEVDIEDSSTTDATLEAFHAVLGATGNLRLALQACLRRTGEDLEGVSLRGGTVRLVKGAYDEPATVAWKKKADVDASYFRLVDAMMPNGTPGAGEDPAFGTHDHRMIAKASELAAERGVAKDRFEFQMLLGVRRDLQLRLAGEGFRVRIYVPFGTEWYPYFMRRMAERPANALFGLRAMLGK